MERRTAVQLHVKATMCTHVQPYVKATQLGWDTLCRHYHACLISLQINSRGSHGARYCPLAGASCGPPTCTHPHTVPHCTVPPPCRRILQSPDMELIMRYKEKPCPGCGSMEE